MSDTKKSVEELAEDLIRIEKTERSDLRMRAALQYLKDIDQHADDPTLGAKLRASLRAKGSNEAEIFFAQPFAELQCVPLAIMRQCPVGHGGFHIGALGRVHPTLRWAYDCGSLTESGRARLAEEIRHFAGGADNGSKLALDLLFLSHFDRDHVSGVTELMAAFDVKTVVIPYLDDLQRAAALVDAHANEVASAELDRVLVDPVAWLLGLGASRVVEVSPADDATRTSRIFDFDGARYPDLPRGTPSGKAILILQDGTRNTSDEQHLRVQAGAGWMVASGMDDDFADWCLVPYVTPATEIACALFARSMRDLLGLGEGSGSYVDAFREKMHAEGFIPKVKAAYKEHGLGDANAVSMSLYSGPRMNFGIGTRDVLRTGYQHAHAGPGWLLTGDAKLDQVGRRTKWLRFFQPVKGHIGALMLPHHGSPWNFHEDVLHAARERALIFACKRAAGDETPLREKVWAHVVNLPNHVVSEDPNTALLQVSGYSGLNFAENELRELISGWLDARA